MVDALALTTTALSGLTAATTMVGGGWARLRAHQANETTRTHFYLTAPAQHLWRPTSGRLLDIARLCEGAGFLPTDATFSQLPAPTWARALGGGEVPGRCVITIPAEAASGFRHAAAGCGVVAVKVPHDHLTQIEAHASAVQMATKTPVAEGAQSIADYTVPTEPGWFLGLNGYGRAVEIYPVAGSTVVLVGPVPLQRLVIQHLQWLPGLFTVIGAENVSQAHELEPAWRAAWNPNQIRIVVAPPEAVPATIMTASDAMIELFSEPGRCVLKSPRDLATTNHVDSPTNEGVAPCARKEANRAGSPELPAELIHFSIRMHPVSAGHSIYR